ncbi:MAG: helix-turn-helix domain-containing protein [Planctomycetota bacterium]
MLRLDPGRYLTPTAARRDLPGARIIETTYARGQCLPRHSHDSVYMVVVTSGLLRETAMSRSYDMTRGWVVLNSAGEAHHDEVLAPGTRCLNIELTPTMLANLREGFGHACEPLSYAFAGAAIGAVSRLQAAMIDPASDVEVEEAVVELAIGMWDHSGRTGQAARDFSWLARVIERLHEAPATVSGVSLRALADFAGVHPTHLCRSFRAAVGCTLGEYSRRLRADAAFRRVTSTDAPLASVAQDCGFADQSHLTREFKARFGRSPARVRNAARR